MRTHALSPPDNVGWKGEFGVPAQAPPVPPRPASTLNQTPWQSATPSQLQSGWKSATPTQLKQPTWQPAQPSQSAKDAADARLNAALNKYKMPDKAGRNNAPIERRKWAGGIRYMQIVEFAKGSGRHMELGNTLTFKFRPENAPNIGSWIPIFWLPWQPDKILQTQIPPLPIGPATYDDESFPPYFFTAGLSGCSVFAFGDPQAPTITHAGTVGNTKGRAGEFWRMQMAKTKSGYGSAEIRGEVNAHMYADSSQRAATLAKAYRDFLASSRPEFQLEVQSTTGCVFGLRTGRSWTLYLQKNAVLRKTRFYKMAEVEARKSNNAAKDTPDFFAKGTDVMVKEETSKATITPKKIGPLTIGKTEHKIYSASQSVAMPLQVVEFYPGNQYVADFEDVFRSV